MKLIDFKFKLTDLKTGESAVMSFDDLYGYEGEACGIFIKWNEHIPQGFRGRAISLNSGCDMLGCLDDEWDIEAYKDGV